MEKIKKLILEQVANQKLSSADAKEMLSELSKSDKQAFDDDIAIIGMASRFPMANNVDEFWDNIKNGVNCICDWPEPRRQDFVHVLKNPHYSELLFGDHIPPDEVKEGMYVKGGYLNEIDKFDADFFGIPPREARYMDPRQRLILEVAWEAIEDSGYGGKRIYNTKTGVFIGKENTNFTLYKFATAPDPMHLTGGWVSIHASRISYLFNLHGPCMIVDTACSSGMSSVHVAIQSIKNKESDMAIVGAINTSLNGQFKYHKEIVDLSSVQSDTGTVKTFDKDANGTVWGEGVGMILIKPLKKALEDRDNIHAIIKGSALNNDGASNGITAPSAEAQEEVLLQAWEAANINPETISYLEAHGTGTVLGDPIELKGLTNAFRKHTNRKQFCAIGSLKPNMGHLVATSGMAALIKVVLSLKNKQLPPLINFNSPNPYINFPDSPVYISDHLADWETDGFPRRAVSSSFGFSGTNCHLVMEEYINKTNVDSGQSKKAYCLTISAKKQNILRDYINRYVDFFNKKQDWKLADLCYTSNTGRGHYAYRIAIVAETTAELVQKVNNLGITDFEKISDNDVFYGSHKIVSDNKKALEAGEITSKERKDKTDKGNVKISELAMSNGNFKQLLREVCSLYAFGGEIEWEKFYDSEERSKTSIPVYPLERIRMWADPKESKVSGFTNSKEIKHPLLDKCLADSISQNIYNTLFSHKRHWVLTDHKIMGNGVIPGTTYLEMARTVASTILGQGNFEFRDIIFLTPLLVNEDEDKNAQTIVEKEDDYIKFTIASKSEESGIWIKHCEGKVYSLKEESNNKVDIASILKDCTKVRKQEELVVTSDVFQFGPRWNAVRKASHGPNQVFIELELLEELKDDVNEFFLHPSLLDNAVNILSQSFGEGTYLPLMYKSFKTFRPLPAKFYSHVCKKNNKAGNLETITFDITLIDEQGTILALITDYSIKKVHQTELTFKNLSGTQVGYHQIKWLNKELSETISPVKGKYLLLGNDKERIEKLSAALSVIGSKCVIANFGTDYKKESSDRYQLTTDQTNIDIFIAELANESFEKIILVNDYMFFNDVETDLKNAQSDTFTLYHLVRSIIKNKLKVNEEFVVIAPCINIVNGTEKFINAATAAMFGLAKTIGKEHSNLQCKRIDADDQTSIKSIMNELGNTDRDYSVSYRSNIRFVEQLNTIEIKDSETVLNIRDNGVYLITGGTGGLGLEFCNYLADKAKCKLILINRTALPEKSKWTSVIEENTDTKLAAKLAKLIKLEEMGSEIHVYAADSSSLNSMQAVISDVKTRFGNISGILHAAGVAGDGFLMRKEENIFSNVLNPKINGTLVLDYLTRGDNKPDFFVLFSSVTTIVGVPGQSDYTAANAFLDAYAEKLRLQGIAAIAINWPAWREAGMAVDYQVSDDLVTVKSLSTANAMEAFSRIISSGETRVIPGVLNYNYLAGVSDKLSLNFSQAINKNIQKQKSKQQQKPNSSEKVKKTDVIVKGKSNDELTEIEKNMSVIWATVLGLDEIDIYDSFQSLGGDSILATHLLKVIESEYAGFCDISDIFSYPSVVQLSEYIEKKKTPITIDKQMADNSDEKLRNLIDSVGDENADIDSILNELEKN